MSENIITRAGPTQGDHPLENAAPTKNEPRYPTGFEAIEKRVSLSKNFGLYPDVINTPSKIKIIPPTFFIMSLFSKKILPTAVIDNPRIVNTVENPKIKKMECLSVRNLFSSEISLMVRPVRYITYVGINGKIHGVKKVINPPKNALNNSSKFIV